MNIEEALYSKLSTTSGVMTICSTRIYPNVIPQDAAMPALAYQRISTVRYMAHDGPTGVAQARFQFTCSAALYSTARSLANAIRVALDGFSGLMGGTNGVVVEAVFVENDFDGYNQAGGEQIVRLDVLVMHQE
jgi:hypothetical protein